MRFRLMALLLVSIGLAPVAANAQIGYFGQNRVLFRSFDFRVLRTEHFDIYFYPEKDQSARMVARMSERWYARLSGLFGHELTRRQIIILYAAGSHFRQTNTTQSSLGEGVGGFMEAFKGRLVMPLGGTLAATDHVLGHEIVHAFQFDMTDTTASNAMSGRPGALAMPLWFVEGQAEYLSLGPNDPHTAMWVREAIRRDRFPGIERLDNPRYFPYRYGQALFAFIGGRYGDQAAARLLTAAMGRDGVRGAFRMVLGVSYQELSQQWRDASVAAFKPIADVTKMPADFARPMIVDHSRNGGGLNVSPELSPDGKMVAFFSTRSLFSIDLFIADAATGRILRRVTNTATSAHIDSLGFIDSAGAWSRDSKRFVFPTIRRGVPVLNIVDASSGRRQREIRLDTLDEILNPSWSPDGNRIAFTARTGGLTDLFIYDLQASQLRRLTEDAFAELQPAWSPDGSAIAIATDRFTTQLPNLRSGNMRIGIVNAATGTIRELGGFPTGKNINPRWSGDGLSLFFISDTTGISNIYRMSASGGEPALVTNLLTGVSGIADMSPALSVTDAGVAFSVFENNGYNIYAMTPVMASTASLQARLPQNAGILPPRITAEGTVASFLQSDAGLPPAAVVDAKPYEPYRPRLSVDFIGAPTVAIGVDSMGAYVGGGISALFSSMLGNHLLAVGLNASNHFDELGASAVYLNRTHRWNWGASFDQTPFVARATTQRLAGPPGQQVVIQEETRQLQIDRGFSGILSYPFSRAQRVEMHAGYRQITGKTDVTTTVFDFASGRPLGQQTDTISTFPTLNLGMVQGALVYDTSIFGMTSPILGTRYRLSVDHTGGDLSYSSALADGRTYFMPKRPFTIALRGLYYGRFGDDAESSFLSPVFLGDPNLVRGYEYGSFTSSECGVTSDGSCPIIDNLIGSRMIVGNVELRAPLWGAFGGSGFYGPLPIEIGVFADAGQVWAKDGSTQFRAVDRSAVSSVGALMRFNLFGFAIGTLDYAHPLNRPGRGWIWQFSLRPGF